MSNDLVQEAARLLEEQAGDYELLIGICQSLGDALTVGEPGRIDSATRTGEIKLQQMRARLVRIIRRLTDFAEKRSAGGGNAALSQESREEFERASKKLFEVARLFKRNCETAAMLTNGGATFAAACIEHCGIKPSTYRQPYVRNPEMRPWA